jgi:hypothetical protein
VKVVVSQPMFLPWIGLFEQIKLADIYVHYDDVQMPRGRSFVSRVQIKVPAGSQWLSASIDHGQSKALISETFLMRDSDWRERHLNLLMQNYREADEFATMLSLAERIYAFTEDNLATFNQLTIEHLTSWLKLETEFGVSSTLGIKGSGTKRLIDICRHYGASEYITGHGARNYLDHEAFEKHGIKVSYIDYDLRPYKQLHGEFTPYVTILDAVANIGSSVHGLLTSKTTDWRDFLEGH